MNASNQITILEMFMIWTLIALLNQLARNSVIENLAFTAATISIATLVTIITN